MEELTAELAQVALELIAEFGADIVYTAIETEAYDPAKSRTVIVPSDPKPAKALVEDYNLQGSGAGFSSGLIKSGDKKFTLAGEALSDGVEAGGKIRFGDSTFTVMNVKTVYLAATPILFEAQGRA